MRGTAGFTSVAYLTAAMCVVAAPARGADDPVYASSSATIDLKRLSLEELMELSVTSLSKKEERLFDAAAAIFVITQEDIRRSGATTIPRRSSAQSRTLDFHLAARLARLCLGSRSVKVTPSPALAASRLPPCCSMMRSEMLKPRPVPSGRPE